MSDSVGTEKRSYLRIPVAWEIQVQEWDGDEPAEVTPFRIVNASADGLAIEPKREVKIDEVCVLKLGLPNRSITAHAIVRWTRPGPPLTAGIQFFFMDTEDERYLNAEMEKLARESVRPPPP